MLADYVRYTSGSPTVHASHCTVDLTTPRYARQVHCLLFGGTSMSDNSGASYHALQPVQAVEPLMQHTPPVGLPTTSLSAPIYDERMSLWSHAYKIVQQVPFETSKTLVLAYLSLTNFEWHYIKFFVPQDNGPIHHFLQHCNTGPLSTIVNSNDMPDELWQLVLTLRSDYRLWQEMQHGLIEFIC